MKFFAQISNNRLIPEFSGDYDKIAKLKPNTSYLVEIKQPRNIKFHRKYWALMNLCFENQEQFNNLDEMESWILMRSGYYKRVQTPTGEMFQPESISFSSMDELKFQEVYERCLDTICLWLDTSKEEISQQLVNFF